MYSIIQFLLRVVGSIMIIFAIILSTEKGESFFVEDLGLPVKNSLLRVLLDINDDVANSENILPENNNQPIFGVFDVKSFLFIVCLVIGFICVSYNLNQLTFVFREGVLRSSSKMHRQMLLLSRKLKEMSDLYYQTGGAEIDRAIKVSQMPRVWPVLISNIQLKIPLDDILDVMGNEAGLIRKQYDLQIKGINTLANIVPSLGVIGTVLGLIKLLYNLSDPSQLGPSMALALLTTLYGLFFSVIVIKPISVRLENIKNFQMDAFQIAAFWVGMLADGKPSFYLEQKFTEKPKPFSSEEI